jgi:MFS family permease
VLIVVIGSGWVFLANALTFIAMIGALAIMRPHELVPRVKMPGRSRLADGFRYVGGRPDLIVIFVMVFILGAFGMNFPIFASTMALEFGQGADGFGLLSSILAIGSLTGALLAARRERARLRLVVVAAGGFALAMTASALAPTYVLYAITLVFVGFSVVTMLTTANGYVQTTTDPALRGRVIALYMAVLLGGTPVGAPVVGWIASEWGPRAAIVVAAIAALLACGVGVAWTLASGRLRRHESRRFSLTLDETRPIAVIAQPVPEEFSDEVAGTTPIALSRPAEPSARTRPRRS